MAYSKKAKRWIIILSVPVVLIIICVVGLKLYLTSDRLKALVIPRIEGATHRSVSVGDVSLSLFPTLGVSVENLKISNPAGVKFERDEFLSLSRLLLDVKLFPLLRNRLEIDAIVLEHPKLYIEVTKEGARNYKTLPASREKDTAKIELSSPLGGALLLSNLRILSGEIDYIDRKSDSRAVLTGFNGTARAEILSGKPDIHVEANLSADQLSYGTIGAFYIEDLPLKSYTRITYRSDKDILELDSVRVMLKDLPLSVRGTVSGMMSVMTLDMVVSAPQVQMKDLLSLIPPEMLKASKGLNSSGDVKFSLNIKGESSETASPAVAGSFALTNGTVKYASLPKTITGIMVSGTFERPGAAVGAQGIGRFSVDKFDAMLGSSEISGKMELSNFEDPAVAGEFRGSLNLSEVKEYYPIEQGTELTGTMKANVSLEGKAKVPTSIKASGQITFENVTVKTPSSVKPLRNLNGAIAFNNQVVESKGLAMNIGESDLKLSFVMKNYLSLVMGEAKTSGKPGASVTLASKLLRTADLTTETPQPAAAAAKKPAAQQTGLVPGFDVEANVSIDKLVTDKFQFTNARGSVVLSGGVATLKNFTVNAFQGTVITRGMLDARNPKQRPFDLDIQISGVEANDLLPKFTSFGQHLFGKLNMNTKLKGDLNDTLGINTQTLVGNGTVQIFDGKLVGFAVAEKLAEITGLPELSQITFKNWANAFEIANGRITIKDLHINSGATDLLIGGSQGLDGTLDYSLSAKLPAAASDRLHLPGIGGEILQFFKDKDGRFNLSFLVGGTSSSPSLKLDTKAQEELAKKALQQKGTDELKKKLNDALKGIFK